MPKKNIAPTNANKLWIARDPDYDVRINGFWESEKGPIRIFYDTPVLLYDSELRRYVWGNARQICEIPNYMFPNITAETSPAVFTYEDKRESSLPSGEMKAQKLKFE